MINGFRILAHGDPPPEAERIIFCDGSSDGLFRERADLELSHWRPNRTPLRYRADTSTAIAFRFLDDPIPAKWTLAVNNHLDIDGILSVYTLIRSDEALARREAVLQAARMGDFWGWGEPPAQRLFQGLTRLMNERKKAGIPPTAIYEEAFNRAARLIDGTDPDCPAIERSLDTLHHGIALVEADQIKRRAIGEWFTHYVMPASVVRGRIEAATYIPEFNELISEHALLWPQARAKWDDERVCLVSAEVPGGWQQDLWFPGYLWADTEGRWTVPGFLFQDGMQSYVLTNARLIGAVQVLSQIETAAGTWSIGGGDAPAQRLMGNFPVVVRFLDADGQAAPSDLSPHAVAAELAKAFT